MSGRRDSRYACRVSSERGTQTDRDELAATELAGTAPVATGPGAENIGDGAMIFDGLAARVGGSPLGTIGRFRLDASLGSGGMADVYRAYDPALERAVALKILRAKHGNDDPQRLRRVLREARAAAALTHPNPVTIFDVGEADGEVFIAMELLEGSVLRAWLGRADVAVAQKLRWLLEAARALAAAHERGLVHRDVKPDNMFVCESGVLKLLDFGIAKRREDDSQDVAPGSLGPSSLRTAEGRRVGTPRYMAPEQHAGAGTDARTDEYAWGLVAFELLTGTHPSGVLAAVTTVAPGADAAALSRALLVKVPTLSIAVVAAVVRTLELRKEDRFASMGPLVEALEQSVARGEPSALSSRAMTRRPVAAAVVALVAVAGAAGAVGLLRARSQASGRAVPSVLVPACRVESTRSLAMGKDDRFAVLPDGEIVTLRDFRRGLRMTRETPSGPVPFSTGQFNAIALASMGTDYTEVALRGMSSRGASWAVAEVVQTVDKHGSVLVGMTATDLFFIQAIASFRVTGTAAVDFGKAGIVLGVTTQPEVGRRSGAHVAVPLQRGRTVVVEEGDAAYAAMQATESRLAFAYVMATDAGPEMHLAVLDETAQRLGDIHLLATLSKAAQPAVAFAGDVVTVFWIDDHGPKTRLMRSNFTGGDLAVPAPVVALDEPTTLQPPVTGRLPSGEWLVAWATSTGGAPTLRVSPIGRAGALVGPTDVTKLSAYSLLRATASPRGVELSWLESGANGTQTAKIAHVTCAASP